MDCWSREISCTENSTACRPTLSHAGLEICSISSYHGLLLCCSQVFLSSPQSNRPLRRDPNLSNLLPRKLHVEPLLKCSQNCKISAAVLLLSLALSRKLHLQLFGAALRSHSLGSLYSPQPLATKRGVLDLSRNLVAARFTLGIPRGLSSSRTNGTAKGCASEGILGPMHSASAHMFRGHVCTSQF